uniref:Uncharacterized protein n=1 Tax=Romanomermis culicivorax TaxID=13658 RepID=A0A915J3X1_ROMCU
MICVEDCVHLNYQIIQLNQSVLTRQHMENLMSCELAEASTTMSIYYHTILVVTSDPISPDFPRLLRVTSVFSIFCENLVESSKDLIKRSSSSSLTKAANSFNTFSLSALDIFLERDKPVGGKFGSYIWFFGGLLLLL